MGKSPASFVVGDEVEVICQDEGFKGSLYEARIVRWIPRLRRYTIEYEALRSEADPAKNLQETVSATHIRPRPHAVQRSSFEIGEKVDAFHNDGWWSGEISKVLDEGKKYMVQFPDAEGGIKEEAEYGWDQIRIHMDWIHGQWSLPKVAVQENICGTEQETIRQMLHAISSAHQGQIPFQRSTFRDGADEDTHKSHHSAANLMDVNPNESLLQVKPEASKLWEKSKIREAQDYLNLYDCLLSAKDVKLPSTVNTMAEVTPQRKERSNLQRQQLGDNRYFATSPIDKTENRLFNSDMLTNAASSSMPEEFSGGRRIYADIIQHLTQGIPSSMVDPLSIEDQPANLAVRGYVDQRNVANSDRGMDTQQPRKKVITAQNQEVNAFFGNILGREFQEGERVEICSDDEGFCGAWYIGTVVGFDGKDFCVEYQDLRTDDNALLLRETVDSLHIRPIPPLTPVSHEFKMLEEVDAFHNDGWWVGVISKVLEGSRYMVYFRTWNEEIEFNQSDLRLHHEFIDGKWQSASEVLQL